MFYNQHNNDKKNLYQINQNYSVKQKQDNLFNPNNYLVVSNTKKDEVNSNKNTTSIFLLFKIFNDKYFIVVLCLKHFTIIRKKTQNIN